MNRKEEMENIIKAITQCTKCPLYKYRRNPVPGEGPLDAEIMFIGEAPGASEDEQGRPFVGAAGKLLTELLEKNEIKRSSVYITNIIKCRPPGNRDPEEREINACLPYLIKQISIIKPKLIVTLGRHAGRIIYKLIGRNFQSMSKEHGKLIEGTIKEIGLSITVIPTFHPAAALYKPDMRRILEEDFKVIREFITSRKEGKSRGKNITLDIFLKTK